MNITKIYHIELNQITAYLAGVIIGDGHISNATKSKKDNSQDYKISIELSDLDYLKIITSMIKSIINTKSTIKERKLRLGKSQHYCFQFRNKSFYYFLTKNLEIPKGNKCSSVFVPKDIMSSAELHWAFLAGLFDTDGGIRSNTIGFTSASEKLIIGTSEILNNLKINHSIEQWKNKKYNRNYWGLKIKAKSIDSFLNNLPMKNNEKRRKVFRHVDVPEWSNGMVNSLTKSRISPSLGHSRKGI